MVNYDTQLKGTSYDEVRLKIGGVCDDTLEMLKEICIIVKNKCKYEPTFVIIDNDGSLGLEYDEKDIAIYYGPGLNEEGEVWTLCTGNGLNLTQIEFTVNDEDEEVNIVSSIIFYVLLKPPLTPVSELPFEGIVVNNESYIPSYDVEKECTKKCTFTIKNENLLYE